jgi:hypothetical protein
LKSYRELNRNLPKFLQALKDDKSLMVAFLTLTLRSDKKRGLRGGIRKVKTDFRKLRKRDVWEKVVGGFGRIENTRSNKFGWHPHLHSCILIKDFVPQKDLSANWQQITGDSKIVDIRRVSDIAAGLVETIKYPFKPTDLRKLGREQIQEMLEMKGERLGVSFGVLFGLEPEADIEEQMNAGDEYAEFVDETKVLTIGDSCPICQTSLDLVDFSAKGFASFLGAAVVPNIKARGRPN